MGQARAGAVAVAALIARRKKKRRSATRLGKGRWRAADLVKRDFPAAKINTKWYGDGTEIKTGQGKLYLASILDMASRRVLGFALGEHHDAQLVYGALAMAVAVRGGQVPGVILHSDRGCPGNTPQPRSARRASGCRSAGRWAGPGPRWTRGHRILALDPGIRAPLGRALHHQGRGPGQGLRLDSRLQPHPPALRLPVALCPPRGRRDAQALPGWAGRAWAGVGWGGVRCFAVRGRAGGRGAWRGRRRCRRASSAR